jgi:hypothetical protein
VAPRKNTPAVPSELDPDDVWAELSTANAVPPLKVAGIVLQPPTREQIRDWEKAGIARDAEAGERALFGDQYDAIQALFAGKPNYMWENFNRKYLSHFFGVEDDSALKS